MSSTMREIPDSDKHLIADTNTYRPVMQSPNPKGWYHSVVNVASTPEGLVATYRLSDVHCAMHTTIMTARSRNGGVTWTGHRPISHLNAWEHHAVWIAPQLCRLNNGRLVLIADRGHRTPQNDWPMLTDWQRPPRGMSNHLFWSDDHGGSWTGPTKIDDLGAEPSYIVQLADGTLLFTLVEVGDHPEMDQPPQPWGLRYYRCGLYASTDGGESWQRRATVTDAPYYGDVEVGLVELEPGHLLAVTRIGFGGGRFGQPSRLVHSRDGGHTWEHPEPAPFYGARTMVGRLQSGRLLVTFRNVAGTPGSCAFVWDPEERFDYQPNSTIWQPDRCRLENDEMVIDAGQGTEGKVEFRLFPALTCRASVEFEARLRIESSETPAAGVEIGAGYPIRLARDGLLLPTEPAQQTEVPSVEPRPGTVDVPGLGRCLKIPLETTRQHHYRFVREAGQLRIEVDGRSMLCADVAGRESRHVLFGGAGDARSAWQSVRARVDNPGDVSIDWSWRAEDGLLPDWFQRARVVLLDRAVDSGYSGWCQRPDGGIVIVDYTNRSSRHAMHPHGPVTSAWSYLTTEEFLAP